MGYGEGTPLLVRPWPRLLREAVAAPRLEMSSQVGQGLERPGIVEGVPAHSEAWHWMEFKVHPTQGILALGFHPSRRGDTPANAVVVNQHWGRGRSTAHAQTRPYSAAIGWRGAASANRVRGGGGAEQDGGVRSRALVRGAERGWVGNGMGVGIGIRIRERREGGGERYGRALGPLPVAGAGLTLVGPLEGGGGGHAVGPARGLGTQTPPLPSPERRGAGGALRHALLMRLRGRRALRWRSDVQHPPIQQPYLGPSSSASLPASPDH